MKKLTSDDISGNLKGDLFIQSYQKKPVIDGVEIIEIKKFSVEDGTFEELVRINEKGCLESVPEFQIKQINRSEILPGAIKAWHIHLNQEDIWYVSPNDHMILGLWDVRESSATKDVKMRIVMGGGSSKLVLIPRGVAHGVVNVSNKKGTVIYFVNQQYNIQDPDEYRLPWDKAGADFWTMEKG